jgi:predicted Fe-Mo cluster-binding NifX family protein
LEVRAVKVAVSSEGTDLDARVSTVFGRCPCFLYVDSQTMQAEAVPNLGLSARGGAGVRASEAVVRAGAEAVVTGNVGPNAMQVLIRAGIPVYMATDCSVREAVAALNAGTLEAVSGATVGSDFGKLGAARP